MNVAPQIHFGSEFGESSVVKMWTLMALEREMHFSAGLSKPTSLPVGYLHSAEPLYRTASDTASETIYEIDGSLLYVYLDSDSAGQTQAICHAASTESTVALPTWITDTVETPDERVKVRFWNKGSGGASMTAREIDAPLWDDINSNYTEAVRGQLSSLMALRPAAAGVGGKLILWSGPPGTGKTYAIRALAQAWREWCDPHYIMDPEAFFGSPEYMMEPIMAGDRHEWNPKKNNFRLIILEDAGELVAIDARVQAGQALSRLLNVTEGMVGQGLKVFFLLTTNEELGKLHPAIIRSGRCFANVKFNNLSTEESNAWIGGDRFTKSQSLADLYAAKYEAQPAQA